MLKHIDGSQIYRINIVAKKVTGKSLPLLPKAIVIVLLG